MSMRTHLAESHMLRRAVTASVAGWLRLCRTWPRWQVEGLDEVRALAAQGPVVLVLWHEHLLMAPVHWQQHIDTPIMSIHDTSPIGRLAGELQPRFGATPMAMSAKQSSLATSRAVLKQARAGVTIAITADGPIGPRHSLQDAPLVWARVTGQPVVVYASEMRRARRLKTWDRLVFPVPFGRAACVFAVLPADHSVDPGKEAQRARLAAALTRCRARALEIADCTTV